MLSASNKTIAILLIIALTITFLSTFITIDRLTGFRLTGAATDTETGVSNLTISSVTQITNQVALIEFGSGYVNSSCSSCVMDSDGKHNQTGRCCMGFNNVSSGFLLENTGNENISVNYTCAGNCTAAQFIGGTSPAFKIKATANSAAGQSGENGAADSVVSCFTNFNITGYADVTVGGDWICGTLTTFNLSYANAQDAFVVDLNLSIPHDAPAGDGSKSATFTFNAHSS